MTRNQNDEAALRRCCCGNAEAMEWLRGWNLYVHRIDDIIDGDADSPEAVLNTFAQAVTLYSHPFYVKHMASLRVLALTITNAYADSVEWEKSKEKWQREWSDHHRHCGAEMVLAVAMICGGYEHSRAISLELRTVCFLEHHTTDGKVV
jgi:hypothetical protein